MLISGISTGNPNLKLAVRLAAEGPRGSAANKAMHADLSGADSYGLLCEKVVRTLKSSSLHLGGLLEFPMTYKRMFGCSLENKNKKPSKNLGVPPTRLWATMYTFKWNYVIN